MIVILNKINPTCENCQVARKIVPHERTTDIILKIENLEMEPGVFRDVITEMRKYHSNCPGCPNGMFATNKWGFQELA